MCSSDLVAVAWWHWPPLSVGRCIKKGKTAIFMATAISRSSATTVGYAWFSCGGRFDVVAVVLSGGFIGAF